MSRTSSLRQQFHGEIAGFGTASGHRVVVGHWTTTPFGTFVDVMHEAPDGNRTLYAPTDEIAAYIAAVYVFDRVCVTPLIAKRTPVALSVQSSDWSLILDIGNRTPLGWLLRLVPRPLATSTWWCAAVDPIARVVLRGVRTRGTARSGSVESYGAVDRRHITAIRAELHGQDLGALAPVDPPVRFGFGSVPRRPGVVELITTVETAAANGEGNGDRSFGSARRRVRAAHGRT